ncbi:MAG TPA: hypothetical protein ENI09_01515 [candidate division WWE3 bacterium]|uniref:Uncharacterized protein n=1 Tax=candidate division WWE3 bacterium TaxID=2053526 RepID=A0A7C1P084_UNCKA|nr:hypothetical protein [candidate division WWE3 bacterium]
MKHKLIIIGAVIFGFFLLLSFSSFGSGHHPRPEKDIIRFELNKPEDLKRWFSYQGFLLAPSWLLSDLEVTHRAQQCKLTLSGFLAGLVWTPKGWMSICFNPTKIESDLTAEKHCNLIGYNFLAYDKETETVICTKPPKGGSPSPMALPKRHNT